jgi:KRAB domain-containing zinc finger protein
VHIGQKLKCSECDHLVIYKSDLVRHRLSVQMGHKLQCPECEYQPIQKSHLVTHRDLYIWDNISSVLSEQSNYNIDIVRNQESAHMGQKFQCQECEYQATCKSSLVTHQKTLHMGQSFQCPECEDQATQKSRLITHQKSVHIQQKSELNYV